MLDRSSQLTRKAVVDLAVQLHAEDLELEPSYGQTINWREKLRSVVNGVINNPSSLVVVAYSGEIVVGIAIGFPEMLGEWLQMRMCMNLREIYVLPGWRDRRVGTGLLNVFESQAYASGFDRVTLFSHIHNLIAESFYWKHGYTPMTYAWSKDLTRG